MAHHGFQLRFTSDLHLCALQASGGMQLIVCLVAVSVTSSKSSLYIQIFFVQKLFFLYAASLLTILTERNAPGHRHPKVTSGTEMTGGEPVQRAVKPPISRH